MLHICSSAISCTFPLTVNDSNSVRLHISANPCPTQVQYISNVFNLESLHGKSDKKVKDTDIDINICGAGLLKSQCGPDATICDGDKLVGKASKETLSFSSGRLELSYEGM